MEKEIIYFLLKCKFVDNVKLQMEVQAFQKRKVAHEYFVNFLRSRNVINDEQYKIVLMAKSVADRNVMPPEKIVSLIYKYLQIKPNVSFLDWLVQNKIIDFAPTKPIANNNKKMGRYHILDKVGQGGMGEVYKAFDPYIKRHVAIKVLKEDNSTARFMREVEICGKLKHQNIVSIYDIGKENGQYFFVMDFIEGKTLSEAIEDNKLSQTQMLQIIEKIARAVDYAHQNNIIHRDIKPQNIMIDPLGEPKILDFGLAKSQEPSSLTAENQTIGTVFYMAPEQIDTNYGIINHKTDIYALGVVLYCCLAKTLPFNGINTVNVINKILYEEPQPLSTINQNIAPQLEEVCKRAMAKDINDRYDSALQMANAIHAYTNTTPQVETVEKNLSRKLPKKRSATNNSSHSKAKTYIYSFSVLTVVVAILFILNTFFSTTLPPQISYRKVILNEGGDYTLAARDEIEINIDSNYLYVFARKNNEIVSLHQYFITPEMQTQQIKISSTSIQYDEDWYLYPSPRQLELKTIETIVSSFRTRGLKGTDTAVIENKGKLQWRIFNVADSLELKLLATFDIAPAPFALEMYVRKKHENLFTRLENVSYVKEGDELQIRMFAHEKMYHLAIFFRDSKGNVGQIFPQKDSHTQPFAHYFLDTSKQQFLPHENGGFEFDHNIGDEHILCFFDQNTMNCQELLNWVKTINLNPGIGSSTRGLVISSPKLYQVTTISHK